MLKVARSLLLPALQAELDRRQAAVDNNTAGNTPWDDFIAFEHQQAKNQQPTLKEALKVMFHGKCAYCETNNAREIEHHWPKSPHPQHNGGRGTPARMFHWDNLVWACHTCNSFECKGSHMKWDAQNRPLLLNPANPGDDPFCYLEVNLKDEPEFTLGWLLPRTTIAQTDFDRAEYTIRRLKLNLREDLRRGRARIIIDFLGLMTFLAELGPDFQAPSGYTVRQRLLDLLAATEPYLAPVRHILYGEPDYAHLRLELISQIPELEPILAQWALPPDDCQEGIL